MEVIADNMQYIIDMTSQMQYTASAWLQLTAIREGELIVLEVERFLGIEQQRRRAVNESKNLRMKAARVAADMSQTDLARAVGSTRQTIGLIEAGGYNPTLKLCIVICKTLGCTLDNLFWEEER